MSKTWVAVRVGAVVRLERGFIGEYAPEHACGDSGIDESMGGVEEVVVVIMKVLLEGLNGGGEFLLQCYLHTKSCDVCG